VPDDLFKQLAVVGALFIGVGCMATGAITSLADLVEQAIRGLL
jgi:hypothetical protein